MEMDLPRMHPFLFYIALPLIMLIIYLVYFKIRPQMVSAGLVVWFAVWLRRFAMNTTVTKAGALGILSFMTANVHAGVWAVLIVLFMMQTLERIGEKKLNRYDLFAMIFIVLGGLANAGGWNSLTYFLTLSGSPFTKIINEWTPVSFSSNYIAFATVILFILSTMYSIKQRPFRLMLFIGMMYLGLASYKQFLYLLLFLPYFMAVIVERFKWTAAFQALEPYIRLKYLLSLLVTGLLLNFAAATFTAYNQPVKQFPVEEMNYILQTYASVGRPKVLSNYVSSGYVMFRGGDVLADGRFDPFILDATRGIHQWTAFERSVNGFRSGYLMDVIRADRPDFLIVPALDLKENANSLSSVGLNEVKRQLPEPDFTGSYGQVWDLRRLNP